MNLTGVKAAWNGFFQQRIRALRVPGHGKGFRKMELVMPVEPDHTVECRERRLGPSRHAVHQCDELASVRHTRRPLSQDLGIR